MNYQVVTIPPFDKAFKKIIRKYPSFLKEFESLIINLKIDPRQGKHLGNNCYKIRVKISAKNKGKSGGGRLITCVIVNSTTVYLISIYDKATKETITNYELKDLLSNIQ